MDSFWDIFKPKVIVDFGGLTLALLIILIENGVFFGFFLPGDSLLFTIGLLCYIGVIDVTLTTLILSVAIAAFMGYYIGYWFGYKTGNSLYKREDTLFFKKKYVHTAEDFYKKYGGFALVMGRFLPIVRTFAPILAGVVRVNSLKFFLFNLIGAVLWPVTICGAGYYVGSKFPNAIDYLDFIVIGFILVTTIPIANSLLKKRKQKN
ncbi:MAG: DedA family protein [Bacteroidia bacterium]|nr:DedA family protein [Bacteroidia bacterium]MCZ2140767.1 DedA family protein [Bacteroidia bacterium]